MPLDVPCECVLGEPTNEACPHHGSRPWNKRVFMDMTEVDIASQL